MAAGYELYLIRHGIAEDRGEAWPDDTKRPLTEQGIARLKKEARGLARLGVSFDVVLTSPQFRTNFVPVMIGARSFAAGLVFDSRVFADLASVAPVLAGEAARRAEAALARRRAPETFDVAAARKIFNETIGAAPQRATT